MLAAGIALIALGILGGAWWGTQVGGEPTRVLVLSEDVDAGEVLLRSALRGQDITAAEGLTMIPADDVETYLGMVATGNLPAGTLLTPSMFADTTLIRQGQALVGIVVTTGQVPVTGVRPGDQVTLVVGASSGAGSARIPGTGEEEGSALPGLTTPGRTWEATVAKVSGDLLLDGVLYVDIEVAEAAAVELAAAAATSNLSIVLHALEPEGD